MTSPAQPNDFSPGETATTSATVVSLFMNSTDAVAAVRDLKHAGFTDEEIGIVLQDSTEQPSIRPEGSGNPSDPATAAAASGSIVGGLIGLLGSLLIPGLGPLLLGGVLASTIAGAGIGAAAGGLIAILAELGVSQTDAEHFERGLRAGGVLVTVTSPRHTREALEIIRSHGAELGAGSSAPT